MTAVTSLFARIQNERFRSTSTSSATSTSRLSSKPSSTVGGVVGIGAGGGGGGDGGGSTAASLSLSSLAPPCTVNELVYCDLAGVELFRGYPPQLLDLASLVCLLFMMIGVPGNLITVAALFKCRKVRNATAVFIINLSISDLMFCCFNLPLAASTFWFRSWKHGDLLCQLFPFLRYGLLAVSLFTVLAITINRYIMISHPDLYPKIYSVKNLVLMVGSTWALGFGALVPTWRSKWGQFGLDPTVGSCSILPDASGHSPKQFLFLTAFVIPCICIVSCYARIYFIVRLTTVNSRQSRKTSKVTYHTKKHGKAEMRKLRPNFSTDDSALGTSSYSAPSCSTERTTDNNSQSELSRDVVLQMVSLPPPNPNYLLPPSATHRYKMTILPDPSSSSGIDGGNELDDGVSSGTSACSSRATSPSAASHHKKRTSFGGRRLSSMRVSNVTGAIFRRNSRLERHPSLRRRSQATGSPGKMSAKDRKLLKMILVIFGAFVICYLPITVSKMLQSFDEYHYLHVCGYLLIYLTTCINPIIYVVMSSEYRQAYKNLLFCRGYTETQPARTTGFYRKSFQRA